jgi:hypothetical protein
MLKFIDSGCSQHPPGQITLTGLTAALVARLILNLPPHDSGHIYICEHGHNHCLRFLPCKAKVASSPPGLGYAGGPAAVH